MLQTETLPTSNISHPISDQNFGKELKDLLLNLAKEQKYKNFGSLLRSTANQVREKSEGYNRKVTKNKIIKLLREFEQCELIDFTDETGIAAKEIKEALQELTKEGIVGSKLRRRWQEPGKHFNEIYFLK